MRLLALPYYPSLRPTAKKAYTVELTVNVAVTVMATSPKDALDKVYEDHQLPRDLPWDSTPVLVALLEKNPPSPLHEADC
ncbi:hypothetical protein [Limnohabitans sp.]